ncbi:head-tail adaptor protein [Dyadobacter chenwenxiniae]|uniref:Head-tail adaptor protein n=1 Tax=Dyadobacter chenwenxiniae TaxID=2906456 RepID=A0A9X1PHE9_9BACT|nr:head-tail adaptor protein [Dyadobacter chenwenxiniae]MCF0059939.1 head-tail adaptor protein [Dyadobacter chenwenxiniae]UON85678.1 head-tail adaptor protein [Dyadobacter chenwenxiniae]
MVGINPGMLREKVGFYSLTKTKNASGKTSGTEIFEYNTLAAVKPMKAVGSQENARLVHVRPYMVTIRYRKEKEPKVDWLMKYKGKTYLINEITEVDVLGMLAHLIVVKS